MRPLAIVIWTILSSSCYSLIPSSSGENSTPELSPRSTGPADSCSEKLLDLNNQVADLIEDFYELCAKIPSYTPGLLIDDNSRHTFTPMELIQFLEMVSAELSHLQAGVIKVNYQELAQEGEDLLISVDQLIEALEALAT